MPNAILTAAIDALASRRDLSADQTAEVLSRDHARRGLRDRRSPASWSRCARRARRSRSSPGWPRTMRELAAHVPIERDGPARHRRHGRRAQHVQRLDHRRADRRRRRLRRGQARQPLGHEPLGLGRPARGARRAHRPRSGRGRRLHRARPASASCSRPPTTRPRASSCPSGASWPCARSSTCSGR